MSIKFLVEVNVGLVLDIRLTKISHLIKKHFLTVLYSVTAVITTSPTSKLVVPFTWPCIL